MLKNAKIIKQNSMRVPVTMATYNITLKTAIHLIVKNHSFNITEVAGSPSITNSNSSQTYGCLKQAMCRGHRLKETKEFQTVAQ